MGSPSRTKLSTLTPRLQVSHHPATPLVEIAIVDDEGRTVLNKLVNPGRPIGKAKWYHGITDEALAKAPTLRRLWPAIEAIVTGCHIVMYNADFDRKFFPKRLAAADQEPPLRAALDVRLSTRMKLIRQASSMSADRSSSTP